MNPYHTHLRTSDRCVSYIKKIILPQLKIEDYIVILELLETLEDMLHWYYMHVTLVLHAC